MHSFKVLEIGHGGRPLRMKAQHFLRRLPADVEYHGVDIVENEKTRKKYFKEWQPDPEIVKRIRRLRELVSDQENIKLYRRNGIRIGKSIEEEFDEVHLHNITSDVDKIEFLDMVSEARRLLRNKGQLIVSADANLWNNQSVLFQIRCFFRRELANGEKLIDRTIFGRDIRNSYLDWDERMAVIATK